MKKSTLSILLFLSLLPLAGCEKINPPSQTETPTVSATEAKAEKILYIDNYPLTAYYQYELLDLSDLLLLMSMISQSEKKKSLRIIELQMKKRMSSKIKRG